MKLEDIKGLGEKRIAKLNASGIYDPLDILLLFPRAYFDKNAVIDWSALQPGDEVIFRGKPVARPAQRRIRKNLSFVKCEFDSCGMKVVCTWFNQDYVYKRLVSGGDVIVSGKLKRAVSYVELTAPKIISDCDADIVPVYKLPDGLNQKLMREAVSAVLSEIKIQGYVNDEIAGKAGIIPIREAVRRAHFPTDISSAKLAIRSAAIENLAYTLSMYKLLRTRTEKRRLAYPDKSAELCAAIAELPFELTADQKNAIGEIISCMRSDEKMNLLLQGDVGSGKTVVAFFAAYYAALGGFQAAIMAPTEILARQHYETAKNFFGKRGLTVVCLTGTMPARERAQTLAAISNGSADITVGTHALIGNNVCFYNLGLIVTDEQHRFGVCQRGSLENKGYEADSIVMSATPIPRTLALSLYGRLKTVSLREKPHKTNSIMTAIVPESKVDDMFAYIKSKAETGEKTYIVCPRIDGDDEISVLSMHDRLSRGALRPLKVGLLHGRMTAEEKDAEMNAFARGDTNVLVCTTVIEVGVDVPEATTMAIFGADRLGLSQLHQLRGRIGRRGQKSYCFIACTGFPVNARLKKLCECYDGFELAEYDFNQRGAGDFLGTRQHGRSETFSGVKIDAELIRRADKLSDMLLSDAETANALAERAGERDEFIRSLSLN